METSNNHPVWSARVLDLTRTAVAYRDLEAAVAALQTALGANIHPKHSDESETLAEALTDMHTSATDAWLKGTPVRWNFYDITREAAIDRAEQLQALADDAATAADYIRAMLAACPPLDTPELLSGLITEAGSVLEDGQDTPDLAALWHRLGPSDLIDDAAAVHLRRQFDTDIDATADPELSSAVIVWRSVHLSGQDGPVTWDYDTFDYAIRSMRAWPELIDVWDRITPAMQAGQITAAEAIRLRDAISARVRNGGSTPAIYRQLRDALVEYDTSGIALSARIRHAEDVVTLENVWEVLRGTQDLERLGMIRALLRKARAMQIDMSDDDTHPQYDVNRIDELMSELDEWHRGLFVIADDIAAGRGDNYSQEEAYRVLHTALEAADDTGNTGRRPHLAGMVERAHQRGRLTDDRHAILVGLISPTAQPLPIRA